MDVIELSSSWTHFYPEIATRGDGLLVVLEPEQIREPPEIAGHSVTIFRPDGTVSQLEASSVEVHHSVVAIFFKNVTRDVSLKVRNCSGSHYNRFVTKS